MKRDWMLYGCTGYTGKLVVRHAMTLGMKPIIAGRCEERVTAMAREHGLPYRIFPLTSAEKIARHLNDVFAVLHCAGPFMRTCKSMVDACMRTGTHYLDITGEVPVLEQLFTRHEEVRSSGIACIPGVGFDIVPSDCLALMLKEKLPSATQLRIAFHGGITQSPGTWKATIEAFPRGGFIRRDGVLTPVPHGWKRKNILFNDGNHWCMTIPWGDVSSAYQSTSIPNIEVYIGISKMSSLLIRAANPLRRIASPRIRSFIETLVDHFSYGADEARCEVNTMYFRGDVSNGLGEQCTIHMQTADPYVLTAQCAVAAMAKLMDSDVSPGVWTPAQYFGSDFIRTIRGATVISE